VPGTGPREEEERGGKRWAAPVGQKGRGEGKEPGMVFHISDFLFLFLSPEFHTKY
jgi:hypothetical protein